MELIGHVLYVSWVLLLPAAALLFWHRRKAPAGSGSDGYPNPVELLARGPQYSLYLLREAGRGLLVETSPAGCKVLATGRRSKWS